MSRTRRRFDPYLAVISSRIRAQRSYPVSFRLDMLGALAVGVTEFAEVWVIFAKVGVLGGLNFHAILLVFGLSNLAFSSADMVAGHLDRIPEYIRQGTLDVFYLRPQSVLAQLMTSDFELRRVARIAFSGVILSFGFALGGIHWNVRVVALVVLTYACGVAIFAGIFVCAGSLQFFLINGAELTNSFTYGGSYAASQPASLFPNPLKLFFGYLAPVVFTGYLPTLAILRLPGPAGLPSWLAWCSPLAAAWVWILASGLWRLGIRHYQGGGG